MTTYIRDNLIKHNILHYRLQYRLIRRIITVATFVSVLALGFCMNRKTELEKARNALGADIVVLPEGTDTDESVLYGGSPVTLKLDASVGEIVKDMDGVSECTERLYLASLEGASCCDACVQVVGVEEGDFLLKGLTDETVSRGAVIVGSRLGLSEGDSVRYFGREFTVTDVLEKSGTGTDLSVYIDISTAQEIVRDYPELGISDTDISAVFIRTDNAKAVNGMIKSRFGNSVTVAVPDKKTAQYTQEVSLVQSMSFFMVISVMVISCISLGGLFYIHTMHRKTETGSYRLIGFTDREIFKLYCSEACREALMASLYGMGLSVLVMFVFTRGDFMSSWSLVIGIGFTVGFMFVSVLFVWLPMRKITQMNTVDLMKGSSCNG